ncbi:disease resistance protein RGA5-like [Triticum dicoccoides]|uniref:disease resistance protein RGA5-like n=1 Tax=Triticum dicoccoides TaxID=85692 RepID=UPI00188E1265|nr:disease resistance protein RGA5-like [Triticum dicoccoides]
MAGAVLSALLHKLDAVLTDEYNLQRSLRGEIMFLRAELESMQEALERVSSSSTPQPVDMQVRIWVGQVRELSYDVEDSIDRFMVRVDLHHPGFSGFIGRCLSLLTTARVRHRIAADIRGIKGRVKEVADRRDRYKVDDDVFAVRRPVGTTTVDPRLHGMYEDMTRLVAVGGPRAELCRLLVEQESSTAMDGQLKVVSIVGVGGLGKTTLANVVYQQIRGQFDCDAFVMVSLKPDLRRVLGSLLRQVSKQSYSEVEAWDVVEIIDKIRQVLRDKRYLIIVDHIWDESAWNYIKTVLVENNCSSRVITTTRTAGVAASCSSSIDGNIYKLNPLGHDDSKKLFYERIFGSKDGSHVELREISEKIIRKCDGVPLAIITIASLLSHKSMNIHEWDTVNKSICSGLEKFPNMEDMQGAMRRLQTLEVTFQVREAKDEYNNFEVGLENLHSIKLVTIRMHCSGSRLVEVEEADAAMRKTSYVNPKHPRVDVIRYYEDEMIEDEEKSQLDEEAFKEQEGEKIYTLLRLAACSLQYSS